MVRGGQGDNGNDVGIYDVRVVTGDGGGGCGIVKMVTLVFAVLRCGHENAEGTVSIVAAIVETSMILISHIVANRDGRSAGVVSRLWVVARTGNRVVVRCVMIAPGRA